MRIEEWQLQETGTRRVGQQAVGTVRLWLADDSGPLHLASVILADDTELDGALAEALGGILIPRGWYYTGGAPMEHVRAALARHWLPFDVPAISRDVLLDDPPRAGRTIPVGDITFRIEEFSVIRNRQSFVVRADAGMDATIRILSVDQVDRLWRAGNGLPLSLSGLVVAHDYNEARLRRFLAAEPNLFV